MISFMTQLFKILFSTFVLFFATSTWGATSSSGIQAEKKSALPSTQRAPVTTSDSSQVENSVEKQEGIQITTAPPSDKEVRLHRRNPNIDRALYMGLGYFNGYGTNTDESISSVIFSLGHLQIQNSAFHAYEVEIPQPGLLGASGKKGFFFTFWPTRPFYAFGVRAWFQGSDQLASVLKYERYAAFAEVGLGDLWTNKQMASAFLRTGMAMNGFFISSHIQWQFPY